MRDFVESPAPTDTPGVWARLVRLVHSMQDPRWVEVDGAKVFALASGANSIAHGLRRPPAGVVPICRGGVTASLRIESIGERTFVVNASAACSAQFQVWP